MEEVTEEPVRPENTASEPKIDDAKQWSDTYCPLRLSDFKRWLQEPLTQKRK